MTDLKQWMQQDVTIGLAALSSQTTPTVADAELDSKEVLDLPKQCDVFDFVDSPPGKASRRRIRKPSEVLKKRRVLVASNKRWGFDHRDSCEEDDVGVAEKPCSSCKKKTPRRQVTFGTADAARPLFSDSRQLDSSTMHASPQEVVRKKSPDGAAPLKRIVGCKENKAVNSAVGDVEKIHADNLFATPGINCNDGRLPGRRHPTKRTSVVAATVPSLSSEHAGDRCSVKQANAVSNTNRLTSLKTEASVRRSSPKAALQHAVMAAAINLATEQPGISGVESCATSLHTRVRNPSRRSHPEVKRSENISRASLGTSTEATRDRSTASLVKTVKRNAKGETRLHTAAIKGDVKEVKALLAEGMDPNVKDNAGWTPLHEACNRGHVAAVTALLDGGAEVRAVAGADDNTALHDATMNGHVNVVTLLLARGASPRIRNMRGLAPADYAVTEVMKKAFESALTTYIPDPGIDRPDTEMPVVEKIMLLGIGLKPQQKQLLQRCAELLDGTVATQFTKEVTHVVMCNNKWGINGVILEQATAAGKWIVSFEWVENCIVYDKKVIEEAFMVQ
ncbi:PREDICTED: BRCA1-associated RING domain protein 1-like isoform X2 [Priapulus caudatus]|nr:PREDICTED: BRCA1-associated RING domain protein 1-like isoform X2 [Priapulus caudatus]